jgi:hypothetical protein
VKRRPIYARDVAEKAGNAQLIRVCAILEVPGKSRESEMTIGEHRPEGFKRYGYKDDVSKGMLTSLATP